MYLGKFTYEAEESWLNIGLNEEEFPGVAVNNIRESGHLTHDENGVVTQVKSLLKMQLLRDNMNKVNERERVDLIWLLGSLGGVSSAILYFCKTVTSFVSDQLYHG